MTITPHLLSGAAIASAATTSLPVAFLIGLILHFVLDALPHTDPGTFFWPGERQKQETEPWPTWIYIFAATEFIIVWLLVIILFKNRQDFGVIMAGGLGGIFIDIVDNNPLRFIHRLPVFKQIHFFHEKVHFDLPAGKWYWGLLTQLIIIIGSLWYLLKF